MSQETAHPGRRTFLKRAAQAITGLAIALSGVLALKKRKAQQYVWQIDPHKCVQCGRCATDCVLEPSAVRCLHAYEMCGYCDLCFGYFLPNASERTEAAENQACPTGAIRRRFIEEPYFEYTIDQELCIGCGKCVDGCNIFGNGSLYLQVVRDICVNCNECAIARNCAGDAFRRIPVTQAYIRKGSAGES